MSSTALTACPSTPGDGCSWPTEATSGSRSSTRRGRFLDAWKQFSRPSGVYIDKNDVLYVADSESNEKTNPGWKRGIRVGSAKDGKVTAFIPDPEPDPEKVVTSGSEGVTADARGNIYGAEVGPRALKRYVKK